MQAFAENCYYVSRRKEPIQEWMEGDYVLSILEYLKIKLGTQFKQFEFIVYSSNLNYPPAPMVLHPTSKERVLIHLSDDFAQEVPIYMEQFFAAIFKCYLPSEGQTDIVNPFPLGYIRDVPSQDFIPFQARDINVFFSGFLNKQRLRLYKALAGFDFIPPKLFKRTYFKLKRFFPSDISKSINGSYIQFTNGWKQGLSSTEYAQHLYRSKIALCPGGFRSKETYRHFEAMRAGCIIISEKLPKHHFYENSPIIQIETWSGIQHRIKQLLSDPQKLEMLHQQTIDWWNNKCSEEAVANYIGEKLSTAA